MPLLRFLGAQPLDSDDATRGIRIVQSRQSLNAVGGIHAGVLATLLEVAGYLAALGTVRDDEDLITHSFSSNYLSAPPPDGVLEARGEVVHRGGTLAVVAARVLSGDRVVAMATVSKVVRRRAEGDRGP